MDNTTKEVLNFIEENDVKFIRLVFTDIFGVQKNLSIMSNQMERAFKRGIPFDASSVDGFMNVNEGDLLLFPDALTMSILPWRPSEGRVMRFICDVLTPDKKEFNSSSRAILRKAVKELNDTGYQFKIGNECEFYVFKTDDEGYPTKIPYDEGGFFDISPLDKGENIRRDICLSLEEMGITPKSSHHEHGPGQNEIDFRYSNPLTSADDLITLKWVVKSIAAKYGGYASFMPKPLKYESGSGLHLNLYLSKDKQNLFLDSCPIKDGKYFIAGIMNRIREITAILNPTRNSYKRFGEFEAPKYITWSKQNRSQLIRLVSDEENAKIELRSLDPTTNPYLAYACIIYAGLEGIKNKEELTNSTDSSVIEKDTKMLPSSFEEALSIFKESAFIKKYFPNDIINTFIRKKEEELETDEELQEHRYFTIH